MVFETCEWHDDGKHRLMRAEVCACGLQRHKRHELLAVEELVISTAKAQIARGEEVPPNSTAMLVMVIDRLMGILDNNYDPIDV